MDVQGNFLFDKADHRDFLGATLGAGIDRDRVGDILVHGERGAQILTTREMANFLSSALTQVRSVPVTAVPVTLAELRVPPARVDTFTSTEASLRLDAVGSAGWGSTLGSPRACLIHPHVFVFVFSSQHAPRHHAYTARHACKYPPHLLAYSSYVFIGRMTA